MPKKNFHHTRNRGGKFGNTASVCLTIITGWLAIFPLGERSDTVAGCLLLADFPRIALARQMGEHTLVTGQPMSFLLGHKRIAGMIPTS